MTSKKIGRPPKFIGELRTINFKRPLSEANLIQKSAYARGMSIGDYLVSLVYKDNPSPLPSQERIGS